MAAGDVFQVGPTAFATGTFFSIQPVGAGVEWVIHNVYVAAGVGVEFGYFDGSNASIFDTDSVDGTRFMVNWHATTGTFVRVQNVSTSTGTFVSADGIVTK